MIELEWRTSLDAAELAAVSDLLATAAAYDAEAGYSSIDPAEIQDRDPGVRSRLLLARLQTSAMHGDGPGLLAAVMRLAQRDADPEGEGQLVVHPDLRSRGVATMIFELIGLNPGTWDVPEMRNVHIWSFGSHPAVERMSNRLGTAPVRQRWTMVRHLRGPFASPLPTITANAFTIEEPRPVHELDRALIDALVANSRLSRADGTLLLDRITSRASELTLARDGSRPVGLILTQPTPQLLGERKQAAIQGLVVRRTAERRGIGSALLASALATVHAHGAEVATFGIDPERATVLHLARRADMEIEDVHQCFELVRD